MGLSKGQTAGHPNTPFGAKVFYRPSLGKVVFRKPGVLRRSERVIARNRQVAALRPASGCKGRPWDQFVACLGNAMRGGGGGA